MIAAADPQPGIVVVVVGRPQAEHAPDCSAVAEEVARETGELLVPVVAATGTAEAEVEAAAGLLRHAFMEHREQGGTAAWSLLFFFFFFFFLKKKNCCDRGGKMLHSQPQGGRNASSPGSQG